MICRFLSALVIFSVGFTPAAFAGKGNPNAPKGGVFYYQLDAEPETLNPITGTDLYSRYVRAFVIETLASRNYDTYAWEPSIAEKWEISKDGRQFTFTIRDGAKWADGKPITVEDVKFSFDVIFDPKFKAVHLRPFYEGLEKLEIIDKRTVRFTAKEKYWQNFDVAAGLDVLPKHIYGDPDKGHKLNKQVHGSGPYVVDSYDRGQKITLKRNKEWWASATPEAKGHYNFDKIVFKFVKEDNIAIEMLKKGEIDYYDMGRSPDIFVQKAVGPMWGKSVLKIKAENEAPKGFIYVGWNFKRTLFQDKRVRRAMSYLHNVDLLVKKFRFDLSMPMSGPWYPTSIYASKKVKPIPFDPKKALSLLREAGWSDTDKDGVLDKVIDGKKTDFRFTMLYANADRERYYTVFKEDAKQAGVDVQLKLVEWNSLMKVIDEKNFDAISLGWGGGAVDIEPKQIWHSSSADEGGSNFISYSNPEVDKLIDQARGIMDKNKRAVVLRKAYELIAEDQPYTFLFTEKFNLYGRTARIGAVKDTYKYTTGLSTWWIKK